MSNLTVTLPGHYKDFIDSRVAEGGYAGIDDYLQALIEEDQKRWENEAVLPLLREALESGPATPMTREDWECIRNEARERLAKLFDERGRQARPSPP